MTTAAATGPKGVKERAAGSLARLGTDLALAAQNLRAQKTRTLLASVR